jgi:ferric-dicitrate binding protein FerR (iron transport regulator)
MEHEQLIKLVDKYLAGKCTLEEAAAVEQWYASQQKTNDVFYKGDKDAIQESASRSLLAIKEKLGIQENTAKVVSIRKSNISSRWPAAACILLLLSVGSFFYFKNAKNKLTYTVVRTGTGQTKHVKLPDGTVVWLNAGTMVKYASDFNRNDREVYLDGEAFFDVVHDQGKPFDVHSGNVQTHVLGTAFSISAYPNSLINNVTVLRGKVQVSDTERVLAYVLPNQALEYTIKGGKSTVTRVSSEKVVAWTGGKLAFIDMPMQDIAVHLQKWYGVNFVFKNQQLKNIRFTASFNNTISLNDLLAVMYDVSHVNYRVDTKTQTVTYL